MESIFGVLAVDRLYTPVRAIHVSIHPILLIYGVPNPSIFVDFPQVSFRKFILISQCLHRGLILVFVQNTLNSPDVIVLEVAAVFLQEVGADVPD